MLQLYVLSESGLIALHGISYFTDIYIPLLFKRRLVLPFRIENMLHADRHNMFCIVINIMYLIQCGHHLIYNLPRILMHSVHLIEGNSP
ncbi:hypothetical protein D3C73_713760 [compost metagenome]